MTITSAEFIKGIRGTDKILYDGKLQIAFVGRSNVGKSSLINSLVGRNNLARSSTQPGKTIRLDFFLINNSFYFVDLPGYGYAKMSGQKHEDIRKMMLWYLEYSEVKNRRVVLIIDANIGITEFDKEMIELITQHSIDFVIAANKADKLKMGQKEKQLKQIQQDVGNVPVIPYSGKTNEGRDALLKEIFY
ncbi:MAG: putative GTP-binding protein EngB [Candidatus Gottesmanbacteria bacterium GW2011_GWA2_44_17]|uniref:Probable GTP-binding protein EngB n=2 Tax=Candidatus Gottesmaniibacteriota TaxID=1752720 RepID=A0A0G1HL43_9BACT|nr:MAG: putative GTP-binding protein EngB [Microgenomates group bacterium GW2011_GWC1_43_11]KKT38314.1 MAG: putative GTP-binding protein EngB [Candidatus Gottesmanbacteria bacterium GW2011_GWB1_44_11c]KKT47911.1 MAG: putative GTP-binding protein EngB [Candidatus Gottesmanbacteria bacterium GW2011_GWA2_44_17]